ncbi:transcription factor SOX-17-like [Sycon ciliatum]|uniref:transcription factor SOX-17-like n=1 Tax=Sycon ciliatum TaxID=27933 RepID=UPI0031F70C70
MCNLPSPALGSLTRVHDPAQPTTITDQGLLPCPAGYCTAPEPASSVGSSSSLLIAFSTDGLAKRPPNAFMLWARTERRRLFAGMPDGGKLRNSEVSKILGKKWREMSSQEKAPYHGLASRACQQYRFLNAHQKRRQRTIKGRPVAARHDGPSPTSSGPIKATRSSLSGSTPIAWENVTKSVGHAQPTIPQQHATCDNLSPDCEMASLDLDISTPHSGSISDPFSLRTLSPECILHVPNTSFHDLLQPGFSGAQLHAPPAFHTPSPSVQGIGVCTSTPLETGPAIPTEAASATGLPCFGFDGQGYHSFDSEQPDPEVTGDHLVLGGDIWHGVCPGASRTRAESAVDVTIGYSQPLIEARGNAIHRQSSLPTDLDAFRQQVPTVCLSKAPLANQCTFSTTAGPGLHRDCGFSISGCAPMASSSSAIATQRANTIPNALDMDTLPSSDPFSSLLDDWDIDDLVIGDVELAEVTTSENLLQPPSSSSADDWLFGPLNII